MKFRLYQSNKIIIIMAFFLSALIYLEKYKFAGISIGIFILLGLIYSILVKKDVTFSVSFMIGFVPFLVLLRDFVFSYSGFTFLLILIFISFFIFSKNILLRVLSDKYNIAFIFIFTLYIIFGLVTTSNLIYFMKYIEYLVGFILISTLFLNQELLKIAFINFFIGLVCYWISILPLVSQRFQIETIYGFDIASDPSASAAFILMGLILILFDKGRLINIEFNNKLRIFLIVSLLFFLIVSTSRTNTGVFLLLLSIFAITRLKSFIKTTLVVIPLLFTSYLFLNDNNKERIQIMYYDKLFSDDRSLNQVTTGRADQWSVSIYHIISTSWEEKLLGSGIANRYFYRDALKKYGAELQLESYGRAYVLHSLYLIILIEMGIITFVIFLFLMGIKLFHNYKLMKHNELIPFYFTIAYLITIFSNQGIGIIGAMYIAFIFYYKKHIEEKRENEIFNNN